MGGWGFIDTANATPPRPSGGGGGGGSGGGGSGRSRISRNASLDHMPDTVLHAIFDALSSPHPGRVTAHGLALASVSARLAAFYKEQYVTALCIIAPAPASTRPPVWSAAAAAAACGRRTYHCGHHDTPLPPPQGPVAAADIARAMARLPLLRDLVLDGREDLVPLIPSFLPPPSRDHCHNDDDDDDDDEHEYDDEYDSVHDNIPHNALDNSTITETSSAMQSRRLRTLTIVRCGTLDDRAVLAIAASAACASLRELVLVSTHAGQGIIPPRALGARHGFSEKALRALANSPLLSATLVRLHFCGTRTLNHLSPHTLAPLRGSLTALHLASCRRLQPSAFAALVVLRDLEELVLADTPITDADALACLPHLRSLRVLDVSACRQLTRAALFALPPSLLVLRAYQTRLLGGRADNLSVHNGINGIDPTDDVDAGADPEGSACESSPITGSGTDALRLVRRRPQLVELWGGYDRGLTHAASLAPLGDRLESLELRAVAIGDDSARTLASLRELRSLGLGGCRGVSDGVAGAAASLPLLERLVLRNTAVTDVGVRLLADGPASHSLTHVDLLMCADVLDDDGAVDHLRASLRSKSGKVLFWIGDCPGQQQ